MSLPDTIEIHGLKVLTSIGVPDQERGEPQTVRVTLKMVPSQGFRGLADDIRRTIDYHAISLEIEALAAGRPRHLIETLALDIADHLLNSHPLASVSVSIEKRIMPNTDCVAVHLERTRN